jgi:hypothetical protein
MKELLELAAKAAGITGWQSKHGYWIMKDIDGEDVVCCDDWSKFDPNSGEKLNPTFADAVSELNWNPFTDDGDALRLAVKLRLDLLWVEYEKAIVVNNDSTYNDATTPYREVEVAFTDDPYAATRLAIVRTAAEIGKGMAKRHNTGHGNEFNNAAWGKK